jgi:hypothetical protein
MQHTPETIFTRLVVNELERHDYNMRHLMHPRQLDEVVTEAEQNEVNRHNAEMLQYAADLVSTWARRHTTKWKDITKIPFPIADEVLLVNIKRFIEKDAIALCDIKFALFAIIGAHYNMNDKGRRKLLPSIVTTAYRLFIPELQQRVMSKAEAAAPRLSSKRFDNAKNQV